MHIDSIMKTRKFKGSITVEAAFSFTLTIFILFLMLGPLLIIKTSSDFIIELNEMSKARCYYEGIKYTSKGSTIYNKVDEWAKNNENLAGSFLSIENVINYSIILNRFLNKYDDSMSAYNNIKFMYDMNTDTYNPDSGLVRYDYLVLFNLPYNVLNVEGVHKRLVSNRRAFIGADGNRFDESVVKGEVVYVARNVIHSSVYHDDINCTYLVKKTIHFEYNNLSNYRNYNNKKYIKCDYCFKGIRLNDDTVCYVTQYGDRFHSDDLCPLMTAYVTQIPRDDIELYNLRPCFRCVKEEE